MKRPNESGSAEEKGFTAVEALISVLVLSVMILLTVTALQNSQKSSRRANIQGNSQQSARVANDLLTRELRGVGYGIDRGSGQTGLVHAGPWDVVFNANALPVDDNPISPEYPRAIDLGLSPAALPGGIYLPDKSYTTGAETIRYTLDSSGDGLIDEGDLDDDLEEGTPNPRDYVLRREVYGELADGTNGGDGETVAMVRGPSADEDGVVPAPLFAYWIDHDNDAITPEMLHGDTDLDGALSQAEISALTPVADGDLALVKRVVVTVTSEDGESSGQGKFRSRTLVSSVSIRGQVWKTGIIQGNVFQDTDADGIFDDEESPISGVVVKLDNGKKRVTNSFGQYSFALEAGEYTVSKTELSGYTATTSTSVAVTVETGQTYTVDFGDKPTVGVGLLKGTVYVDADTDGVFDDGERGIENVLVELDTGIADTTDANGEYEFQVAVGTVTVSQADSTGYTSTTRNSAEVTFTRDGETKIIDFGDALTALGTIEGLVYFDMNGDGELSPGEAGIEDVPIALSSGDSTTTDSDGEFSMTVTVGKYDITAYDLESYSSSTPNLVEDVIVTADSVVTLQFGDIFDGPVELTEVNVTSTDRTLSLATLDLREDGLGDVDIVLGTQVANGENNLLVWHNQKTSGSTPPTGLFDSTPTLTRNASYTVPVLREVDSNGDSYPDLMTGLSTSAASNLTLWVNQSGSSSTLPMFPSGSFQTSSGSSVLSLEAVTWPGWSEEVLVVGTKDGAGKGHLEIWSNVGSSSYAHLVAHDIYQDSEGNLGTITALASQDFNGDGYPDLAVAQDNGSNRGQVTVFFADNTGSAFTWVEGRILDTHGAATAIGAADMKEDAGKDFDLVVGTTTGDASGEVEVWLNDGSGVFGYYDGYDWVPDTSSDASGAVLSMDVTPVDADVFPDVVVGIRKKDYVGALSVHRTFGSPISLDGDISRYSTGEVVTLAVDDLNADGVTDIVVGTRTSSVAGNLTLYLGQ